MCSGMSREVKREERASGIKCCQGGERELGTKAKKCRVKRKAREKKELK
jgi:hypothetical protein